MYPRPRCAVCKTNLYWSSYVQKWVRTCDCPTIRVRPAYQTCTDCGAYRGRGWSFGTCPRCRSRADTTVRAQARTKRGRLAVELLDAEQCEEVLRHLSRLHGMGAAFEGANQAHLRELRVHARRVLERLNALDR